MQVVEGQDHVGRDREEPGRAEPLFARPIADEVRQRSPVHERGDQAPGVGAVDPGVGGDHGQELDDVRVPEILEQGGLSQERVLRGCLEK